MDDDFRSAMSDVAPLGEKAKKKAQSEALKLEAKKEMPRAVSLTQLERRYAALGIERTPKVDPNPLTLADVPQVEPRSTSSVRPKKFATLTMRTFWAGRAAIGAGREWP